VRLIIYPHVLESREAVVEWMKGTLLTEYEKRLTADQYGRFVEAFRERLLPQLAADRPFLFPFSRILCWGRKRA
jgi:trans-aconitate 2-methyltransferase